MGLQTGKCPFYTKSSEVYLVRIDHNYQRSSPPNLLELPALKYDFSVALERLHDIFSS